MGEHNERNQAKFCLKRDHRAVEHRPGGAHPRAEHGAMRRSLMVGMVPGMFDRLGLRQSADGQDAAHQKDRDKFESGVVHEHSADWDSAEC